MKERYSVWDSVEPDDIRQGALGNCWFLCAISSLAEFPDLVKNIFYIKDEMESYEDIVVQENGLYKVRCVRVRP